MTTDNNDIEYLNKGTAASKKGNYKEAVFWFLQHKAFVSKSGDFCKLDRAKKKVKDEYPTFPSFVVSQQKDKKINEDTTFKQANDLFVESLTDEGDLNVDNLETIQGDLFIEDETEDLHIQGTCKINKSDSEGYGVLIKVSGKQGILTASACLSDEKDCKEATLCYENVNDDSVQIEFETTDFKKSNETGIVFVGFKFGQDMMGINNFFWDYSTEKLEGNKDEGAKATCYTYYYSGTEKNCGSYTIKKFDDKNGLLEIENFPVHVGLPIFMGDQLLGLSTENGLISVGKIRQWLEEGELKVGAIVTANWTDGHPYKAKLLEQIEGGWKVKWEGFNEEGQIQETDIVESQ